MGFSPMLVNKIIEENAVQDVEMLLETLFTYNALQNRSSELLESWDDVFSPFKDVNSSDIEFARPSSCEIEVFLFNILKQYIKAMGGHMIQKLGMGPDFRCSCTMTHQKRWRIDFHEVSFKFTSSACDVRKWEIKMITPANREEGIAPSTHTHRGAGLASRTIIYDPHHPLKSMTPMRRNNSVPRTVFPDPMIQRNIGSTGIKSWKPEKFIHLLNVGTMGSKGNTII
ncbi:hypothetical protein QJS10_CPA05g00142 [Acorus calamus]|uniref:Uncharacterized protein n=1 Tax=Acorus calamus TaxID=4465 RepID=A0AAV9ETR9_ACOCL|nr:hypothetical protein QJS10_CPA05g00142 [Acorus calamus]